MNISFKQINNLIVIETDVRNGNNFSQQEKLFYKILSEELLNNKISLITLQPQSYSLGYEQDGNKRLEKIANKNFLINYNISYSKEFLLDIIQSEEFRRGLLFVISNNIIDFEKIANEIVKSLKEEGSINFNVKDRIYYTEKDGNTFCLFNSGLTIDHIRSIVD